MNPRKCFLLLLAVSAPIAALAQYREFKNKQGASIEARPLDKTSDSIILERKDGKVFTVKIETLSEQDVQFVQNWSKINYSFQLEPTQEYNKLSPGAFRGEKLKVYTVNVNFKKLPLSNSPFDSVNSNMRFRADEKDLLTTGLSDSLQAAQALSKTQLPTYFKAPVRTRSPGKWNLGVDHKGELYVYSDYFGVVTSTANILSHLDFLKKFDPSKEVDDLENLKNKVR